MIKYTLFILMPIIFMIPPLQAQDQEFTVPTTNPHATIQQRLAATDIKVMYNRPSVKGRNIFGGLVPYDQVWRTGSDASTKISFSTPVTINGKEIHAGTYELFTIPGKEEWTVILQQNRSQWGSYSYTKEFDVVRTRVTPLTLKDHVETFTIGFDPVTSNSAILTISWDNIKVPVQIVVDLKKTVLPQLEASLLKEGRKPYFTAAMFYFENNLDIDRAAELMALAIKDNPKHIGMLYRQALILRKKGAIEEAIEASELSLEQAKLAKEELRKEYIRLNTALLEKLKSEK